MSPAAAWKPPLDAVRMQDLQNITDSLEVYHDLYGRYPHPGDINGNIQVSVGNKAVPGNFIPLLSSAGLLTSVPKEQYLYLKEK